MREYNQRDDRKIINHNRKKIKRKKCEEMGICTNCGCRKKKIGYKTCSVCLDRIKKNSFKKRKKGLCVICGRKSGKYYRCKLCREKHNQKVNERLNLRQAKGLCRRCGKKRDRDGGYCLNCLKILKAQRRKLIPKKLSLLLCYRCGRKIKNGEKMCRICKKNFEMFLNDRKKRTRKSEIYCIHCGRKRKPYERFHKLCAVCLKNHKKYKLERKKLNKCYHCNSKIYKSGLCKEHCLANLKKRRERYRKDIVASRERQMNYLKRRERYSIFNEENYKGMLEDLEYFKNYKGYDKK